MGVNPGGDFTVTEAAAMTKNFDCSRKGISDLTGIEYFSNIKSLYCTNNQLSILDISSNTALEIVFCQNNPMTTTDSWI